MNKYLKYMAIGSIALATASCNDFLDVKPVGKMIPTEVSQFENLLNNTNTIDYFMMDNNRGCCYAMLGDNLRLSESHLKYRYIPSFPNLDLLAAYIYYSPMLNPLSTPFCWTYGIYRPVGYFNNVVDGVSDIDSEDEYARGVIAQAKVGRAWVYLNAALCYGPMWDPSGANDTPVIPLRTSGDPTQANGPLATTAEIFAQVKEDLDYACKYAPVQVVNPCRANRAAAYALRAEYNMYTRNWADMAADAAEAWRLALANAGSADKLIYNFNDFYYVQESPATVPDGVDPRVYMTLKGPDNDFELTENRENLLYRYAPYGSSTSRYYPSNEWLDNFDRDNDMRWDLCVLMDEADKGTVNNVTFDDGLEYCNYRADLMSQSEGLTHPLLLITKAEAEARSGNTAEALKSLNLLRKYRYRGTNTDLPGGSSLGQDALLEEILKERRREQPMVSFQRTVDLKRYAFDAGKPWSKQVIEHRAGSKVYSQPITSKFYNSFPIDNIIRQYNPQWGLEPETTVFNPISAI